MSTPTPTRPSAAREKEITIRLARADDAPALAELAALDGKPVPAGTVLLAEDRGSARAALALADGTAVADPFQPTADLVSLLELRAAQMAMPEERPRGGRTLPLSARLGISLRTLG